MSVWTYNGHDIEFDDDTNLPKVSKGYFWRVKPCDYGDLRVQLREKRWIGSVWVDYSFTGGVTKEAIRHAACRVILKQRERNFVESVVGDYPPKKLA